MTDHGKPWGGPPPSYYDPPDDRHCPRCENCHFHDTGNCDAEYFTDRAGPVYCCRECDPDEHKACQYHAQRDRDDYDPLD